MKYNTSSMVNESLSIYIYIYIFNVIFNIWVVDQNDLYSLLCIPVTWT